MHARFTRFTCWRAAFLVALGLGVAACGPQKAPEEVCQNPETIAQDGGSPSGFVICDNGARARDEPAQCEPPPPSAEPCGQDDSGGTDSGDGYMDSCQVDADCVEQPDGRCQPDWYAPSCRCFYPACTSDADCDAGQVCDCGVLGRFASCVPAECASSEACDGYPCAVYDSMPSCGNLQLACHGGGDVCYAASDCTEGQECAFVDGAWQCVDGGCAIGRPFLVHGRERIAGAGESDRWLARGPEVDDEVNDGVNDEAVGLTPARREQLAAIWTRSGSLEHASVAAFARFALQLLQLGAPRALVDATRQAMADELEHARLCFGLASRYRGAPVGPGPLDIADALAEHDFAAILRAVVLEGCVGETLAAFEAAEAREHARDPAVRRILETIAGDERRHALLAWRFVAWAITRRGEQARSTVLEVVRARLDAAANAAVDPGDDPDDDPGDRWLQAHGVLPTRARGELRRRVLHELIAPLTQTLCEPARARAVAPRRP